MIKLEVNNGCRLEVKYDEKRRWTVVEKYDSMGNLEDRYGIEDHDFVSMLNWYKYQKENGNEALLFDGIGIGEVRCIADFEEDGDQYFSELCYYTVTSKGDSEYFIKNNFGGVSRIDAEDFADYFEEA